MANKWPDVDKLARASGKRKDDTRPAKLQITVRTQMPCGRTVEQSKRNVPQHEQYRTTDNLHNAVKRDARKHLGTCRDCATKEGR